MCSCKARRFVEALRSSWIFSFALFLFASAFFGLVCCASHSFGFHSLGLDQSFDIPPRSAIVLVGSEKGLIVDLAGLRKKYLIRCQISSSKVILVRFHKKSLSVW